MSTNSKIEWTHHTANLWHGCTKVHEGCDHCYAETLSHRWGRDIWGNDKPRMEVKSVWKDLANQQELAAAAGEVHRVFVGSMMDLFEKPMPVCDAKGQTVFNSDGSPVSTENLRQHFFYHIVPDCPNLLFLLLTKRPSNINKYIPESWKANPPENVMYGTSPVNQATANTLIPQLLQVNGKRFLSIEPLLGRISLEKWFDQCPKSQRVDGPLHSWLFDGDDPYVKCNYCGEIRDALNGRTIGVSCTVPIGIHWVIAGGESGHGARPMHPDWARSLRNQCEEAGVAFFFKQNGEYVSVSEVAGPGAHYVFPDGATVRRIGKKLAGRTLDGRTYDGFPGPFFKQANYEERGSL